jgi:hypothetical protein
MKHLAHFKKDKLAEHLAKYPVKLVVKPVMVQAVLRNPVISPGMGKGRGF